MPLPTSEEENKHSAGRILDQAAPPTWFYRPHTADHGNGPCKSTESKVAKVAIAENKVRKEASRSSSSSAAPTRPRAHGSIAQCLDQVRLDSLRAEHLDIERIRDKHLLEASAPLTGQRRERLAAARGVWRDPPLEDNSDAESTRAGSTATGSGTSTRTRPFLAPSRR